MLCSKAEEVHRMKLEVAIIERKEQLDDLIPFCKYAIIPYYLWFAWIPCTLFYLLWFNDSVSCGKCIMGN